MPVPEVGAGQVRVRITVAALNFPDVLVVANKYQMQAPTPFIPGSEFAGEVVELGDGVTGFAVGDRVFGSTFIGAFAEEVVVAPASLTRTPPDVGRRVGGRLRRGLQDGVPRAALGGRAGSRARN